MGMFNRGGGRRDRGYDRGDRRPYYDDRDLSLDDLLEPLYVFVFCAALVLIGLSWLDHKFGWGVTEWLMNVAWPWLQGLAGQFKS